MARVAVLGDINIDLTLDIPAYPGEGGEGIARNQTISLGGSAANTATALARLGADVALIGRVGADHWGANALAQLEGFGIDIGAVGRDDTEPTQINVVMVSGGGERTMFAYRGANARLAPEHVTPEMIDDAVILHVSGYALLADPQRSAALKAISLAHESGIPVTLDVPAGVVPDLVRPLAELIPRLHTLMLGEGDAEALTGVHGETAAIEALIDAGVELVALKLGADGSAAITARGSWQFPATPIDPVDTTGAGDAFAAGHIFGQLNGLDLPARCTLANLLGGLAATRRQAALSWLDRQSIAASVADAGFSDPIRKALLDTLLTRAANAPVNRPAGAEPANI